MQTIIIAGGKGTRIKHLYPDIPKPMIPIADMPVLEHQIKLLKSYDITDIMISINHLGHIIEDYFGNGHRFGVNITYLQEPDFLGTAGFIKEHEEMFDQEFLVLYGDMLIDVDLTNFIKFHHQKNGLGAIVGQKNNHLLDCDLFEIDKKMRITNLISKPHNIEHSDSHIANLAVYVMKREIVKYIPAGQFSDFAQDVFKKIIAEGNDLLYAYDTDELLLDIGTPEKLKKAHREINQSYFPSYL